MRYNTKTGHWYEVDYEELDGIEFPESTAAVVTIIEEICSPKPDENKMVRAFNFLIHDLDISHELIMQAKNRTREKWENQKPKAI